ncbi:flagella basal body P-ring formation protein FlgA [Acuticoccus sediminis]|uniref:Flagella basal body P-ring formation protein FlgA n=1 Tax=Acuticoccus sediminis TaxID=2184697 RepID=A0A8B2NMN5_9HYPH|nr:flagellar basal body P-ring formation chaperone FlgA [Acuticoccus sediminis]RAI00946.1 flagella basal body P-ring formation protein FlgA [Acuticoccus sediminis]
MVAARAFHPMCGAALALALAAAPAAAVDQSGGLLPVPAETINRGDTVSADMLTERHFYYDPNRPLAVLTDPSRAIGREARRTLPAGKPIPLNAFQTSRVVFRGKPTQARFRMGNLTITTTVLPQADGGVGDIVQARNLDSNRMVSGIVGMDGAIEVSAP